MMKKIISLLIMFCMMCVTASAFVDYTGAPTTPYLVFGFVEWNDQMLSGTRIEVTNAATGFSKVIATNEEGYWQDDAMSWQTNVGYRQPVMGGDSITVRAMDGCGTADTCSVTFIAFSGTSTYTYKAAAQVDLSLTGELSCPPVSCSCGGGGSSSSGSCIYTEELCESKFPCEATTCSNPETVVCPEDGVCPEQQVCEDCQETICDETEECTEDDSNGVAIIASLIAFLTGSGLTYYFKRKDAQMPNGTFTKFGGKTGPKHLHRGIKGYHDPQTSHREKHERHPKGELDPLYEKDIDGVYKFVE